MKHVNEMAVGKPRRFLKDKQLLGNDRPVKTESDTYCCIYIEHAIKSFMLKSITFNINVIIHRSTIAITVKR